MWQLISNDCFKTYLILLFSCHRHSSTCTPSVHVPRPSPVSPTMLTDYQKRMLWKKKLQPVTEPTGGELKKKKASVVGVHELYENDELLQDWKDVYITSAYLIWCQTNKVSNNTIIMIKIVLVYLLTQVFYVLAVICC